MTAITKVSSYQNEGIIAGTALTTNYQELFAAVPGSGRILCITNGCDQDIKISINGGVNTFLTLPPNLGIMLNFGANGMDWAGSVRVKYSSVVPSSGSVSANVINAF